MSRSPIPTYRGETMRLSRLTNDYLVFIAAYRDASKDTVASYGTAYAQFQGFLLAKGDHDEIRNFDADNVQAFAEHLAANGIAPISVRMRLTALSSFARWAMRQKNQAYTGDQHVGRKIHPYLLMENPLDRVERPKKVKPKSSFLHAAEMKAFLGFDAKDYQALARDMFADTALRLSELVNAKVADLWLNGETTMLKVRLKGGREKNIPLGSEIADRLARVLREREPRGDAPLLVNSRGEKWTRTGLSTMIARIGLKAGVTRTPTRPHKIRHTFNVVADQIAGLGVNVRAELLNHSDTRTLSQYDHMLAGTTTAARDSVRAAMRKYVQ